MQIIRPWAAASLLSFAAFFQPLHASATDEAVIGPDNIYHARALGMAGAATAVAADYSAVYWNPACLAEVRRNEIHLSLGFFSVQTTEQSAAVKGDAQTSQIKFQSAGYVHPFPTSRGSLVMALGYSRPKDFLDAFEKRTASVILSGKADGHLSHWDAALAADLSQRVSLGGSLSLITGPGGYSDQTERNGAVDTIRSLQDGYFGISGNLGLLARFEKGWVAGLNFTLLNYVSVTHDLSDDTGGAVIEYSPTTANMGLPIRVSVGLAYATTPLTLSLDLEGANWSTFKIEEEHQVSYADELANTYRVAVGAEWLVPGLPVKVRAGTGYRTSPFKNAVPDGHPLFYTGGLGLLFDRVLAVDLAGMLDERNYRKGVETVSRAQALLTASYRF